jgi:RNA polymerase sigma factor (sigma-70 family)
VSPEEFTGVYRSFLGDISKYLTRRCEPSDVEELASRVFEIAWVKRSQAPEGFELPWLYRIARYVVSNHRRQQANQSKFLASFRPADTSPSVEEIALADISLSQAWGLLSGAEREALALSCFEGLDNSSAAAVLEISPNAFTIRLSRAKARLRELIGENS